MKLGVISDLHANAAALEAALALLALEDLDGLVVLGDVLSYGCRPLEVIRLLEGAARSWPTRFIIGNHDELYFQLQRGDESYLEQLPLWIQESARWTTAQLGALRLAEAFAWQQEHVVADVLFAHANPFVHGDWTYLNDSETRRRAAQMLASRSLSTGIFGHTHRALDETIDGVRLLNPGSLGQPRDGDSADLRRSSVGVWCDGAWAAVTVAYDVQVHCRDVERSSLSDASKREICKFYKFYKVDQGGRS